MNRPRLKNPLKGKSAVREAASHDEWHRLMREAIERAEKTKDPRLPGLRDALANGKTEPHLRRLGIICPIDLAREFPLPI